MKKTWKKLLICRCLNGLLVMPTSLDFGLLVLYLVDSWSTKKIFFYKGYGISDSLIKEVRDMTR
ncbi:hypothetical protein MKX01_034335, partial [Papaver californicum]